MVCCPDTLTIDDLPQTELCAQMGNKIFNGNQTVLNEYPWCVEIVLSFVFVIAKISSLFAYQLYRMALLYYRKRN